MYSTYIDRVTHYAKFTRYSGVAGVRGLLASIQPVGWLIPKYHPRDMGLCSGMALADR